MSTQKHTPGPWSYYYKSAAQARAENPETDGGGADGFVQKRGHRGAYPQNVAFLPHNRDVSKDEETEANARLIAAAPELLAALKLAATTKEPFDKIERMVWSGHQQIIRSAIAKAEGAQ